MVAKKKSAAKKAPAKKAAPKRAAKKAPPKKLASAKTAKRKERASGGDVAFGGVDYSDATGTITSVKLSCNGTGGDSRPVSGNSSVHLAGISQNVSSMQIITTPGTPCANMNAGVGYCYTGGVAATTSAVDGKVTRFTSAPTASTGS